MKSLIKNYIANLTYQLLIIIIPLITAPYLSRVLGAARIGEYSFAQSIVAYFTMFSTMGTALYGQREMAACTARGTQRKKTFFEIVLLRVIFVGLSLVIYYSLVPRLFENRLLYILASIEIISVGFDISWFYQGIEEFQIITFVNAIAKVIGTIGIFACVKSAEDLNGYVICYCGSILGGNVLQWFFIGQHLEKGAVSGKWNVLRHIRPTLVLFISQLAIQLYTVLDKTMIGLITQSNYENGYYEQSQKLIKALTAVVTSIGAVMASRITLIWNGDLDNKQEQIRQLLTFSFQLIFCISLPMMFGTILVASRFVPLFYGAGYEPVIRMIQCLAVIVPIIGASNIIGIQLFVPTKREKLLTRSVVLGAAANILLNSVLITHYSGFGACVASCIAEGVVTGTQVFLARKNLDLKRILAALIKYGVYAGAMFCVGLVIANQMDGSVRSLITIVVTCIGMYGILLFLTSDEMLKFVWNCKKKS